jgi:hypothetical protein
MTFRDPRRQLSAIGCAVLALALTPLTGARQSPPKLYPLESTTGLRMKDLTAAAETFQGKKCVRITSTGVEQVAVIEGQEFDNGVIEAEIAGAPGAGTFEGARGFVGIAFRVSPDAQAFDAFYLRPTNGRADDQERRNHATQYISHPDWPWARLRKETPSRYESYVDVVPDVWTKVKIDVQGARALLYVHDQAQPALVVNDVKTGAQGKGGVGLWVGAGTVAHFRAMTVQRR